MIFGIWRKNMKRCSTVELRKKEIINLIDGAKIGFASDFEFDQCDARILALVIPDCGGFFGFGGKGTDIVIPWDKIECIGEDTILVRINLSECGCASGGCRKRGKIF